jgi:hypothetical protein
VDAQFGNRKEERKEKGSNYVFTGEKLARARQCEMHAEEMQRQQQTLNANSQQSAKWVRRSFKYVWYVICGYSGYNIDYGPTSYGKKP